MKDRVAFLLERAGVVCSQRAVELQQELEKSLSGGGLLGERVRKADEAMATEMFMVATELRHNFTLLENAEHERLRSLERAEHRG